MTDKDNAAKSDAKADDAKADEAPSVGAAVAAANVAKDGAGNPVLDFNDVASAEAQAKLLGGTVEAIGVAYRVVV